MSAIPIITPRPAPSPASSPAPAPADQRADGATFNAHLQEVQQRQSQASAASDSTESSSGKATSASAGTNGKASQTAEDDDADSSAPAGNQVLGLIQQSSGDAVASAASADGKPAGKMPLQGDAAKPALPAATGMPMPPPMPLPVSAGQTTAAPNDSGTATSAASISAAASAQAPGKAAGAFSAADDAETASADDADASDDDSATAPAPGSTDAFGQASVNTLFGNAHSALAAAADATTPAVGPPQDAGDLAALRGALATPVWVASTSSGAAPHSLNISANVTSPQFSQELGQQVSWLGGQEIKQAQIRLNPQELGPLDVKVSVEHGRVDVVFAAQHPATVAAVQQSLQQLNQMLGSQGLSLGQATVDQHTAQQQFGHSQGQASSTPAQTNDAEPIAAAVSPLSAPLAVGLVDAFA
jgi:flagellar hook-length control protein FliK